METGKGVPKWLEVTDLMLRRETLTIAEGMKLAHLRNELYRTAHPATTRQLDVFFGVERAPQFMYQPATELLQTREALWRSIFAIATIDPQTKNLWSRFPIGRIGAESQNKAKRYRGVV